MGSSSPVSPSMWLRTTETSDTGSPVSVTTLVSSWPSQGVVNSMVVYASTWPSPSTVATVYRTTRPGVWPVFRSRTDAGSKKRPHAYDSAGMSAISVPRDPSLCADVARKTRKPNSVVAVSSHEKTTPHSSASDGTTSAGLPS